MNETAFLLKWFSGIPYELAFWNNVYRWKSQFDRLMTWSHYGETICLEKFDANAFLAERNNPVVLDVGCGMSFAIGNFVEVADEKRALDVRYVDPLAEQFNRIAKRHRRNVPSVEFGMAEYLASKYQNSADLVVIQNALDHSAQPFRCILQALRSVVAGGCVYLNHHPNEAEVEHYKGFHQWNIDAQNSELIIWNKQTKINVSETLSEFANVHVLSEKADGEIIALLSLKHEIPSDLFDDLVDVKNLSATLLSVTNETMKPWYSLNLWLKYQIFNAIQFFAQLFSFQTKMKIKKILSVFKLG